MPQLEPWLCHSAMSDPGRHAAAIAELPSDIGTLNQIIQGLLIHSDWLGAYGIDERGLRGVSRETLPVSRRLDEIFRRDARSLQTPRRPDQRSVGTCRDFALMLSCFLRSKAVPTRVRCGFAAYLADGWEDHWLCEYWDWRSETWRIVDPQLDTMMLSRCGIRFDPSNVPRSDFATAGQAWMNCRDGRSDPVRFGHGNVVGAWFIKVNVVRDHYALNGRETSVWDGWRAAPASRRRVGEDETDLLDDLAARPDQAFVALQPDWLP